MNKSELIALMAKNGNISKAEATRALNLTTDSIIMALNKAKSLTLVGFGSFTVKHRKARDGRNPKTGAKMRINPYNQPVFRAGNKMKASCN